MFRLLFILCTYLSILMLVASLSLWFRSLAYEDSFTRQSTNRELDDVYDPSDPSPAWSTLGRLVSAGSNVYIGYENEIVTYSGDSRIPASTASTTPSATARSRLCRTGNAARIKNGFISPVCITAPFP